MTTFLHGPVMLMATTAVVSGALRFFQRPTDLDPGQVAVQEQAEDTTHSYYTAAAQADQIVDLPGLDYDPGFHQFSGYFTVDQDHGRNLFYWYVESQGDPETDPVVLWTNGGPGCSGFVGFGTEHGPYFIDRNGTLSPNDFSWNNLANMLYIEQPAGVGFSYSDTETDHVTGDAQAASDNYVFILEFLKRFPERRSNPFYISSESYGGHYMPQCKYQEKGKE
jgi:carboxypeptidase C (cathepsin A)